jgi:hypothetical protein
MTTKISILQRSLLSAIALLVCNFAIGQTLVSGQLNSGRIPTPTMLFMNVTPDARSAAMGDAGVAISSDVNAIYWNPAKLASASQDLGFAVEEVEVTTEGEKGVLKFQPKLVAARYHANRLEELMGLKAEELQAKRLLASYDRYKAREFAPSTPHAIAVKQWLSDVFRRVVNQVPDDLKGRVEPAQLFHEVLENRWYLGEKLGRDVGLDFATQDYIEKVLPYRMDSGVVLNK